MKSTLNVIIADDQEVYLDGMQQVLTEAETIGVFHRALSGQQALDLMEANHVDLFITEINMPDMSGYHLIDTVRKRFSGITIIILTAYYDIPHVKPLLNKQIQIILDKVNVKQEFHKALGAMQKSKPYYSRLVRKTISKINAGKRSSRIDKSLPHLTRSEREYLHYIAYGKSNKEIAAEMYRSPSTVDSHRINIYSKFSDVCGEKVNNSGKLAAKARELGFID